ncbi:EpsG family protein [Flavobacterium sp.]|uniref:EpsG family protein n=1 Tax=Flavobacterium sp. TaxID=239 RepID=UPI0031E24F13
MITYIVLFFFLAVFSFTDYIYTPFIYRKLLLCTGGIFIFFVLWSLASLRWKTGTDWDSYYDTFYYFSEAHIINFEPGYIKLMAFIKEFTSNYTVYLAVFSFLCISIKFSFFFKYHKETFFTLILLFYCYYFADIFAVRQNLAISLTLFSTIFIINRKPIFFSLFVALATSIHSSSILYFLAYFIYWRKINDKTFYCFVCISIFFGLSGGGLVLMNLVFKSLGIDGLIADKIAKYLNEDSEALNTNINPVFLYLLGTIKRLIFIPVFMYIKNKSADKFQNIKGYFNLYMIGNIIYFLFAKDLAVFVRASVPFLFFEIMLLSYVLLHFKKNKRKLLPVFLIVLFFSLSRFNTLVNSYYDLYVPYYSIFDDRIERKL